MTTWTKSDAACQQLDAAIGLLADRMHIAAHSLVSAAAELAADVAKATGRVTHHSSFEELVRSNAPHRLAEVLRVFRQPQNFAKHADKDHDQTIDVNPEFTIIRAFQALLDLGIVFERQTFRQVIFRAWFAARYPNVLLPGSETYLDGARQIFGRIEVLELDEALRGTAPTTG